MTKNVKFQFALFLLVAGLLSQGCARTLKITYLSDPPGATIYAGQKNWGYAPVTLHYNVSKEQEKMGYFIPAPVSAQWASGATASTPPSGRADLRNGYEKSYRFIRPANYPGREIDVNFALQLERNRLEQQRNNIMLYQAEMQRQQAEAQRQQAETQRKMYQNSLMPKSTNCTSTVWGNQIITDCR